MTLPLRSLANMALQRAVSQIDQVSDEWVKLHLYFIASKLFQSIGNFEEKRKCDTAINNEIQSYEANSQVNENQIDAASSLLNLMSTCVINVWIPDMKPTDSHTRVPSFRKKEFKECEKLKLRAVAMVDRLDAQNDIRREMHRNLSLWYKGLGKTQLANKQKQVLFELLGFRDENMLYGQKVGCGVVVFWQKEPVKSVIVCGMG
jgi:hypothetical protein